MGRGDREGVPPLGILFFFLPWKFTETRDNRGPAGIEAPHPSLVTAWVPGSTRSAE